MEGNFSGMLGRRNSWDYAKIWLRGDCEGAFTESG